MVAPRSVTVTKYAQYRQLALARRSCNVCTPLGLTNPASVCGGKFDSTQIGPWTRWNGALNAELLIVGQEWGDVDSFIRQEGLDNASATNQMLRELLGSIGVEVATAPMRKSESAVFLTNAALCLKQGGAQAGPSSCSVDCNIHNYRR